MKIEKGLGLIRMSITISEMKGGELLKILDLILKSDNKLYIIGSRNIFKIGLTFLNS